MNQINYLIKNQQSEALKNRKILDIFSPVK